MLNLLSKPWWYTCSSWYCVTCWKVTMTHWSSGTTSKQPFMTYITLRTEVWHAHRIFLQPDRVVSCVLKNIAIASNGNLIFRNRVPAGLVDIFSLLGGWQWIKSASTLSLTDLFPPTCRHVIASYVTVLRQYLATIMMWIGCNGTSKLDHAYTYGYYHKLTQ